MDRLGERFKRATNQYLFLNSSLKDYIQEYHSNIFINMVRFHWICDGGQNSFVPPNGVSIDEQHGVTHINCEMEVSVQALHLTKTWILYCVIALILIIKLKTI